MALNRLERLGFSTLYYLGMASRVAEKRGLNKWGNIGEMVAKAEAYACEGGHHNPALPRECKAIAEWIEPHHQGPRSQAVAAADVARLRDSVAAMAGDPRNSAARRAGLWLGYASGTCTLSLHDKGDRRQELRRDLRQARSSLAQVDDSLAQLIDPVESEAARTKVNYRRVLTMIDSVSTRV